MQNGDHPLEAAFVNPGLAVAKDGNPPLAGCRFRRSSDLAEWSACPAREVVTRIDFVFSIWKSKSGRFFFTVHAEWASRERTERNAFPSLSAQSE